MDTTFQTVLFILLGWFLGLLSPLIHDVIKNKRRTREVRKTIVAELEDTRLTLCMTVVHIEIKFGTYDHKFLEWILPILDNYEGPHPAKEMAEIIRKQMKMTDKELHDSTSLLKAGQHGALHLKKVELPYMEMHIPDFGSFDDATQQQLLAIRAKLAHFNENIDYGRDFFRLTYSELSEENRERVERIVRDSYLQVAERARAVIEHIKSLSPLGGESAVIQNKQHGKT